MQFAMLQKYCVIHFIPYYVGLRVDQFSLLFAESTLLLLISSWWQIVVRKKYLERGNNLTNFSIFQTHIIQLNTKFSRGYLLLERNNESALKVSSQLTLEVEERKKNDNTCA